MPEKLISLQKVSVILGGRMVLNAIELDISASSKILVTGSNGAGKTTLLKTILGLVPVHSGSIRRYHRSDGSGYRFAYIGQEIGINRRFPVSVSDVLRLSLPYNERKKDRLIRQALETANIDRWASHSFHTLSYGQKRRVLLARALLDRPALLVLDEPTNGLDHDAEMDFVDRIGRLYGERQIAWIIVCHNVRIFEKLVPSVVTLSNGRLIMD